MVSPGDENVFKPQEFCRLGFYEPLFHNETAEEEAYSVSDTICSNGYTGVSLFLLEWAPTLRTI